MPGTVGPHLRVAYLGTPEFAALALPPIVASPHEVALVITGQGKAQGRGLRPAATPVELAACELGLAFERVGPGEHGRLAALLGAARVDVLVTVAWGGRLRRTALAAPRLAALNVHPSLLPRWRGAAPVERALLAGDQYTGVTVMHMAERLDEGDIVLSRAVPVGADVDAGTLRATLAAVGGGLVAAALDLLALGRAPRVPQGEVGVTFAPKLTADDERIRWEEPAPVSANRVRALAPRPGAYFGGGPGRVIVARAAVARLPEGTAGSPPGQVLHIRGESLLVSCGGESALELLAVKPAGGRLMPAAAYARGRRIAPGTVLEDGKQ